jgi:hypothetical protein
VVITQDDVRENEMRTLFNLTRPDAYGRGDIDAVLELEGALIPGDFQGQTVPFELKSSTRGVPNISTVRDFGPHYIEKWRPLHWIFGVYDDGKLLYCLYGSPEKMQSWYDEKAAYVRPDFSLAQCVPVLIDDDILTRILGAADSFDYEDAKALLKMQRTSQEYREAADLENGRYSRAAMLEMLRDRCQYVIERGSTVNNPHISPSYFDGWERIERNHAARLRELVVESLSGPTLIS